MLCLRLELLIICLNLFISSFAECDIGDHNAERLSILNCLYFTRLVNHNFLQIFQVDGNCVADYFIAVKMLLLVNTNDELAGMVLDCI